ncbi:hypothetical protein RT43_GL000571 [Enterococcus italicus DSM 15952]|nr:hypothetical protein RT43_GL000571 [Enterococcus italicus DSM 15952]
MCYKKSDSPLVTTKKTKPSKRLKKTAGWFGLLAIAKY